MTVATEKSLSEVFLEWKLGIIPGVTPSLEETMAALKAQWEEECKL